MRWQVIILFHKILQMHSLLNFLPNMVLPLTKKMLVWSCTNALRLYLCLLVLAVFILSGCLLVNVIVVHCKASSVWASTSSGVG